MFLTDKQALVLARADDVINSLLDQPQTLETQVCIRAFVKAREDALEELDRDLEEMYKLENNYVAKRDSLN